MNALALMGCEGTFAGATGVTAFDEPDRLLLPTAFVANTRKVYVVPLARPGTVTGLEALLAEILPGVEIAV
jgi:hypothetical protein